MKFSNYLLFSFLFFPVLCYPQSGVDTVIADWSGGWCSICCGDVGNYACHDPFGGPDWNGGQKSFADPVPTGNIITGVSIILYWVDGCSIDPDTFNLGINNQLIGSIMNNSGDCSCGSCEIDTVSNSWPCSSGGLPNYLYGDTNIFFLGYLGNSVCIDKAVIILNHLYPNTTLKVSALSHDVTCNGGNNGVVNLSVCGGTSPYTYLWSTGDTTEDVSGLSSGLYTVTVTDDSGFVVVDSVIIDQQNPLILTITSSDATCQGTSNGNASVSVLGGVPCYFYSWSSGSTDSTATGLSAGTYTVTVTDFNGCQATDSVTINSPPAINAAITSSNDPSCIGFCDGDATVSVSGGTGSHTYFWNTSPVQTNATATGLCAGTYTVIVSDSNNCADTGIVIITENPTITIDSLITYDLLCYGDNNGWATVYATATAPPLTYLWTDSIGDTIGFNVTTIFSLAAGSYTLSIFDTDSCITSSSFTIYEPPLLTTTITDSNDVTCFGNCDGSATIGASGGVPPYTYLWTDGQITSTADSLCPGMHNAFVNDSNGCFSFSSVIINEPAPSGLNLSITNTGNILCNGDSSGVATVTPSCGSQPFTYVWNDPLSQTDSTANSLSAGMYQVVVTDASGQMDSIIITITEPDSIIVTYSPDTSICFGDSVEIFLSVSGGVNPFVIWPPDWCMFGPPCIASPDTTTIYTISVTDSNGCKASDDAVITVYPPLSVTVAGATICEGDSASLNATATGGNPTSSYAYLWLHDGSTTSTVNVSPTVTTIYQVVVSDSCSLNDTALAAVVVETCTGIEQSPIYNHPPIAIGALIVYPNPNSGQFTLEMDLQKETELSIKLYHFTGQLIHSLEIGNVTGYYVQQIDLSEHSNGVYYLQVLTDDNVHTRKIIRNGAR